MKKTLAWLVATLLLTIALPLAAHADDSTVADLFRYVPTCITVKGTEAKVEGYFVNLSKKTISNITKLSVAIYQDGEELIPETGFSGDNLEAIELEGRAALPWFFTFTDGGKDLNEGTYVVDSNVYAKFACKFKGAGDD